MSSQSIEVLFAYDHFSNRIYHANNEDFGLNAVMAFLMSWV